MITGIQLRDAILSASNNISNHRRQVDELNIFPVPDGDTGTNMAMTISAAARELEDFTSNHIGECAQKAASAMLRGARGNSGVILSLLFRGVAKGLQEKEAADGIDLANALLLGVDAAYDAVMTPTEGTILTVARVSGEQGRAAATVSRGALHVWSAVCENAEKALATTPDLLPVLKKAGVVDAGGKGLTLIFEGMRTVFEEGRIIVSKDPSQDDNTQQEAAMGSSAVAEWEGEITFTYCTEFIVGKNPDSPEEVSTLRSYLESIGDSVVVVDDDEIIKVHVHTEEPGNALQCGLALGQLLTVKIENMREQKRKAEEAAGKQKPKWTEPVNTLGFVAVSAGKGIDSLFTDLGCDRIVSGGQTMNPSTEDILEAVHATPAQTVFVLPNNKNIILAAEQAIQLADRKVVVIPTKTIPQGMSAMLAYNPNASEEENAAEMLKAAERVSTGQVTFAARDSDYAGHKFKEGEILALLNGIPLHADKTPVKAVTRLAKSMIRRDTSFVTLIYGEGISQAEAEEARAAVQAKLPDHGEIILVNGGQPIYYFIMSVE